MKCSDDTDVAFVVDTSGSISDENFVKQKDFIKVLASAFDPSIEDHQLGLISYSSDAQVEVSFRDKANAAQFESAVDRVPHTKGRTRLDKALALAATQVFSTSGGTRSGKRKIMVILTDGRQSQDPDTIPLQEAVSPLRKLGVRVYTVAIGDEVDLNELYQVTEGKEDVFPVSDFANLANMATDIALKTCKVKPFQGKYFYLLYRWQRPWARWSESCVLIGYLRGQERPILPSRGCPLWSLGNEKKLRVVNWQSLFTKSKIIDWLFLFIVWSWM